MILTFNELSGNKKYINSETVTDLFKNLVEFLNELVKLNVLDALIVNEDTFSSQDEDHLNFSKLVIDKSIEQKYRQFFLRFSDKYCKQINTSDVSGEFSIPINENYVKDVSCTYAFENEYDALSFPTNTVWADSAILGKYTEIDSDKIINKDAEVTNVSTSTPIRDVAKKYQKLLQTNISSGQDLWENREQLYPNLIFCSNVKNQLFEDSEKFHIISVMKKLDGFQKYFSEYDGKYDPNKLGMGARTESESVKKNPELRDLRLFIKPDGTKDYFYDHVGFNGKYSAGRIHFLPDDKKRMCYIGYIGRHLPTKKY